jgi:hypothetical protein
MYDVNTHDNELEGFAVELVGIWLAAYEPFA